MSQQCMCLRDAHRSSTATTRCRTGHLLSQVSTLEACTDLLSNDPSIAILAGDNNTGIMILHSFKNLGGTILSPGDRFVCLVGTNRLASIITANEVAVSENCSITTPTADDIIACNDLEELLNLGTPLAENEEDTTYYAGGITFFPLPGSSKPSLRPVPTTLSNSSSPSNPHAMLLRRVR